LVAASAGTETDVLHCRSHSHHDPSTPMHPRTLDESVLTGPSMPRRNPRQRTLGHAGSTWSALLLVSVFAVNPVALGLGLVGQRTAEASASRMSMGPVPRREGSRRCRQQVPREFF